MFDIYISDFVSSTATQVNFSDKIKQFFFLTAADELTDAEEEQGLHAEELLLGDLQQHKLL